MGRCGSRRSGAGPPPACVPFLLSPTRDLLDDDAVVEIAFAGAQAGLEHVGMDLEKRQPLANGARLVEDETGVLEGLSHAAFRREVAGEHLRSLNVHDLRI